MILASAFPSELSTRVVTSVTMQPICVLYCIVYSMSDADMEEQRITNWRQIVTFVEEH